MIRIHDSSSSSLSAEKHPLFSLYLTSTKIDKLSKSTYNNDIGYDRRRKVVKNMSMSCSMKGSLAITHHYQPVDLHYNRLPPTCNHRLPATLTISSVSPPMNPILPNLRLYNILCIVLFLLLQKQFSLKLSICARLYSVE